MTELDYEIRVAGLVPDAILAQIDDVHVTVAPMTSVLRGPIADQAALHAIIRRVHGIGLELIGVRCLVDCESGCAYDPG